MATAAILILTAFTAYGSGKDTLGITLGVLLGIAAGAFVLLDIRFGKILSAMLYLLLPLAVVCALENYTHVITGPGTADPCAESVVFLCAVRTADGADRQCTHGLSACDACSGCSLDWTNYFVVSFRGSPDRTVGSLIIWHGGLRRGQL
ncbi:MAG: hypothetical protein ACLTSZ_03530 [Lachnospiraceae bacterium]